LRSQDLYRSELLAMAWILAASSNLLETRIAVDAFAFRGVAIS
jgi:hypothetical protein